MSTNDIHKHKLLILDFGSQVTQLIARRIREIGVYCELWPWDVTEEQIKEFHPDGIILSGSPESVTEPGSPRAPEYVFRAGVPVLGICYGMQTMAQQLGGEVLGSKRREYGYASLTAGGIASVWARGDCACRVWQMEPVGATQFRIKNVNSGLYLTCKKKNGVYQGIQKKYAGKNRDQIFSLYDNVCF